MFADSLAVTRRHPSLALEAILPGMIESVSPSSGQSVRVKRADSRISRRSIGSLISSRTGGSGFSFCSAAISGQGHYSVAR